MSPASWVPSCSEPTSAGREDQAVDLTPYLLAIAWFAAGWVASSVVRIVRLHRHVRRMMRRIGPLPVPIEAPLEFRRCPGCARILSSSYVSTDGSCACCGAAGPFDSWALVGRNPRDEAERALWCGR